MFTVARVDRPEEHINMENKRFKNIFINYEYIQKTLNIVSVLVVEIFFGREQL